MHTNVYICVYIYTYIIWNILLLLFIIIINYYCYIYNTQYMYIKQTTNDSTYSKHIPTSSNCTRDVINTLDDLPHSRSRLFNRGATAPVIEIGILPVVRQRHFSQGFGIVACTVSIGWLLGPQNWWCRDVAHQHRSICFMAQMIPSPGHDQFTKPWFLGVI